MAKPGRLRELEQQLGPLEKIIPVEVNHQGSVKAAAQKLGVTDSTLLKWLRDNKYVLKQICVKSS